LGCVAACYNCGGQSDGPAVKVADREDSFPSLNSKFSLCAFIFIAIWFTSAEIIGVVIRIQQARPSAAQMAIQPLKLT